MDAGPIVSEIDKNRWGFEGSGPKCDRGLRKLMQRFRTLRTGRLNDRGLRNWRSQAKSVIGVSENWFRVTATGRLCDRGLRKWRSHAESVIGVSENVDSSILSTQNEHFWIFCDKNQGEHCRRRRAHRGFSFGPIRVTVENLFNSLLEPYRST